MSPALAGRVLSTTPSGTSGIFKNYVMMRLGKALKVLIGLSEKDLSLVTFAKEFRCRPDWSL